MNVQGAAGAPATGTARNLPALIRFADGATSFSGFLSALGLLGMTSIVCFEIFSRYIFNAPTSWITEVATYDLVAVAFLGLAAAQRAGAHIQVELLLNSLSARARVELRAAS